MCIALQKCVNEKRKQWKLVDRPKFRQLWTVLDNVMKDRSIRNIGTVKKQVNLISLDHVDQVWKSRVLGEETPDKLQSTVLFLLGVN